MGAFMGDIITLIVAFCATILAIILVFGILYFGNKIMKGE
jgi:hypothetical protein